MKTLLEYRAWLTKLNEKEAGKDFENSIKKLLSLLTAIETKKVFEKDASKIFLRLEGMIKKVEADPAKTKYQIDKCSADIKNIAAKFYGLVTKNYYQNEWTASGTGIGLCLGVMLFVLLDDITYLPIGLAIGAPAGMGIGNWLDKKAKIENRFLDVE
jgi:hypothetical protein